MRAAIWASIDKGVSRPHMLDSLVGAVCNPEALLETGTNNAVLSTLPDGQLFVAQTSGNTFDKGLFHRMHELDGKAWW